MNGLKVYTFPKSASSIRLIAPFTVVPRFAIPAFHYSVRECWNGGSRDHPIGNGPTDCGNRLKTSLLESYRLSNSYTFLNQLVTRVFLTVISSDKVATIVKQYLIDFCKCCGTSINGHLRAMDNYICTKYNKTKDDTTAGTSLQRTIRLVRYVSVIWRFHCLYSTSANSTLVK